MKKMKIAYVTGNNGKFIEVREFLLQAAPYIELEQVVLPIIEIQSMDQEAVARDKACQAYAALKRPLLVDDAAIYFEKYDRFPGVLTRFVYTGIGMEGILKLVGPGDKAYFLLYLVYVNELGEMDIFEGKKEGVITVPKIFKAHQELPFDDIFIPDGSDQSYADLFDLPEFSNFAYRLLAIKNFLKKIEQKR